MGSSFRACQKKKEELAAALDEIANTKRTSHDLLSSVLRARRYNRVLGFSIFTPWTVNEVDEQTADALDAIERLDREQDNRDEAKQRAENANAKARAKAGYRSYANRR